ncbi:MAG: EF-hand domain-containing protein [Planctomycetes bacterium]|nr:EF-hand domain-containing protein [Planctomycetota bacterium]
MIRHLFGVALVGVVGVSLAAEPAPSSAARPSAPLELVLLGEGKPTRVELRVEVDGKPVSAIWDETFAKMFAFFDRNGDGNLDEKEAAKLPAASALRQSLGNGFTPPVGIAPTFKELDSNGDGKVTAGELAAFYRKAGLGNVLVGVGRIPTSAELTDAILKHLDTDGDGKVTEKELKAAAESLKKLDKNDDELIGAGELVPKSLYPGAAGTTLLTSPTADAPVDVLAKLPMILLPGDEKDAQWTEEIVRRRAKDSTDKRTVAELAAWRKQEPDARWVVKLGAKASVEKFAFAGSQVRVEGWATEGRLPEAVASARKQLSEQFENPVEPEPKGAKRGRGGSSIAWLTSIADRNGDSELNRTELDAWLDLQEQIARGQVLLTVLDGGNGLFELLDTNHDGALSVRELRSAFDRVREAGCLKDGVFDKAKFPHVLLAAASRGYPVTFGTDLRGGPAWFRAMDRNGDGDVSRREFTGPAEVFDKLDLDKDGLLSAGEAEKAEKLKK